MRRPIFFTTLLTVMAFMVACGSGGGSREEQQATAIADLRSAIEETVSDDRRQRDVLAIVGSLEKDVDELRALLVRRRTELRELNADYDATRAEFLEFARQMESHIQISKRRALEKHQQLAAELTPEEWQSLANVQTRSMKSIAESVQSI
jgi:chlorite dismutase